MHISEGVLSAPVLCAGAALALAGLAKGLRGLRQDQVVACGVMAAAFFVASLVHVPIGLANAHLLLCGLAGVLLGWAAFPAIFAALVLQALLFQYGGFTTLGVNTASMGYGAVAAWKIFHSLLAIRPQNLKIAAFTGGAMGTAIAAILTAAALGFTSEGFRAAAAALLLAHLPIILTEGVITMLTVSYMARIRPEILGLSGETAA